MATPALGRDRAPGASCAAAASVVAGVRDGMEPGIRHRLCLESSLWNRGQGKEAESLRTWTKRAAFGARGAVVLPVPGPSCSAQPGAASSPQGSRTQGLGTCPAARGDEPQPGPGAPPSCPERPAPAPPGTGLHPQGTLWGHGGFLRFQPCCGVWSWEVVCQVTRGLPWRRASVNEQRE